MYASGITAISRMYSRFSKCVLTFPSSSTRSASVSAAWPDLEGTKAIPTASGNRRCGASSGGGGGSSPSGYRYSTRLLETPCRVSCPKKPAQPARTRHAQKTLVAFMAILPSRSCRGSDCVRRNFTCLGRNPARAILPADECRTLTEQVRPARRARATRQVAELRELADRGAVPDATKQPRSRGRGAPGPAGRLWRHRQGRAQLGGVRHDPLGAAKAQGRR